MSGGPGRLNYRNYALLASLASTWTMSRESLKKRFALNVVGRLGLEIQAFHIVKIMSKRPPTADESMLIVAALKFGCIICGRESEFHHVRQARPNALGMGFPLCPEHHRGTLFPGQSIHSNKLIFEQKYGTEFELLQESIIKMMGGK